tara:strand:- start:25371 stop:25676 length:306 start_codon:yes stop_codon:yes gene_type:complete
MALDPELLAEEAITNIRNDRGKADVLITKILEDINDGKTNHQSAGMVLSKHLETMQRANEQLVKLTSLFKKTESSFSGFSDSEKNEIFDVIKETKKETDEE